MCRVCGGESQSRPLTNAAQKVNAAQKAQLQIQAGPWRPPCAVAPPPPHTHTPLPPPQRLEASLRKEQEKQQRAEMRLAKDRERELTVCVVHIPVSLPSAPGGCSALEEAALPHLPGVPPSPPSWLPSPFQLPPPPPWVLPSFLAVLPLCRSLSCRFLSLTRYRGLNGQQGQMFVPGRPLVPCPPALPER